MLGEAAEASPRRLHLPCELGLCLELPDGGWPAASAKAEHLSWWWAPLKCLGSQLPWVLCNTAESQHHLSSTGLTLLLPPAACSKEVPWDKEMMAIGNTEPYSSACPASPMLQPQVLKTASSSRMEVVSWCFFQILEVRKWSKVLQYLSLLQVPVTEDTKGSLACCTHCSHKS